MTKRGLLALLLALAAVLGLGAGIAGADPGGDWCRGNYPGVCPPQW